MIEVKNLCHSYRKGQGEYVLQDISFSVKPGECVCILGNNGAGKSTLISCLAHILSPQAGEILLNGEDISRQSRVQLARQLAYVAQQNDLHHITVFDFILLGRKPHMRFTLSKEDVTICEEMIEQLDLSALKLRYVSELSGGQRQKVFLARALAQGANVLLLDEPTSDLDPKNQHEMLQLIQGLAKEKNMTVLLVLHDINLALKYCDKFLLLHKGKRYAYGDKSVINRESIRDVYDIHASITTVLRQEILILDEVKREDS